MIPNRWHHRHRLTAVVLLLAALPRVGAAQQQGAEIIRGIVRTADNEPLAEARVIVTGLQTFTRRTTETNAKGQYTVLFGDPEGEYVVSISAIGYTKMTGRARRTGESTLLVIDAVLARAALQLDSVTVLADGADDDAFPVGGQERDVLDGKLFSLDPSSVDALMSQIPGVASIPGLRGEGDRYSVLGASPDQNSVLLDGAKYDGQSVPPGMLESAGAATTTYNAAYGNFAGGQVSMRTRAGKDQFQGFVETRLAHPSLAWSDPRAGNPVPQNFGWNANLSGPIKRGSVHYNFGLSQNNQSRDFVSLLSLNELQREQSGLSADSITAVRQTLAQLGIPVTTSGLPERSTTHGRSAMLRLDLIPSAATNVTFTGAADDSRQLGTGISSLSFPSLSSRAESRNLRAQLSASTYFGGFVDQLSTTFQSTSRRSGPFMSLPSGTVRVGAQYPGGTVGLTNLSFGGGTAGESHSDTRTWSVQHEISRLTSDSKHRWAFGQSLELGWSSSLNAAAPFGKFAYQSLEDLAANRPASYDRTLSSIERSTTTTTGALWLQGESRVKPERLQFEYGVRLDFNRPGTRPQYNPVIDSLFGRRTDRVPGAVGLSPRLGFTWRVTSAPADRYGSTGPVTVRGGVGAFRGVVPPQRVAGLVDATGLPNSIRQLSCVGDATPRPDWTDFASASAAPVACLDGAAPVEFSTAVPGVQLFSPLYRPPTSWRGNVDVGGFGVAGLSMNVGAQYSQTINAESAVDLNLRRTPAFALAEEGGRPMYVAPSSIVPATGAIAPAASRITDRFGAVTDNLSDLKSRALQLTLQANSRRPLFGKLPVMLSYTYNTVRQQQRGFGSSTAGDPLLREWGRGEQSTHQFQLRTSFDIPFASLTVQTALVSGRPYTPVVAGDVNGDGQSNDRAFIFDPAASDPVLAQQMRDLLATATPSTRACLAAQFGRIAERNSCSTGWRLQPDVRFDLRLPGLSDPNARRSALGDRLQLSVTTSNLMGTLLHLAGVSGTSLNVLSGANSPLDPSLLYVDGFDPETQRFRYRVNQQFGEGRPQRFRGSRSRYTGAFQVQLGARLMLGHFERQYSMVQQLGLVSRDAKAVPPPTRAEVRQRMDRLIQDPVSMILTLRDSLLLTDEQIARMETRRAAFQVKADSVLAPVVDYVVERGSKAKDKQVQKLVGKAQRTMRPLMVETLRGVMAELKEEQKERLPPMLHWMADPERQQRKGEKRQAR